VRGESHKGGIAITMSHTSGRSAKKAVGGGLLLPRLLTIVVPGKFASTLSERSKMTLKIVLN